MIGQMQVPQLEVRQTIAVAGEVVLQREIERDVNYKKNPESTIYKINAECMNKDPMSLDKTWQLYF